MNVQTVTPVYLKQQIHQVVEQLPEEQLPHMLHFSETLLNGNRVNGVNGTVGNQSPSAQEFPPDQPWLPYVEILANSPHWDEFDEAIAESRREANEVHIVSDEPQTIDDSLQKEHPWLKYSAKLQKSPNWDEFLECLAEVRREANEDDEVL